MTKQVVLERAAKEAGLFIGKWSPGDGMTRYRFFERAGNTFYGPDCGIHTSEGSAQAMEFLTGFCYGRMAGRKEVKP